MKKSLTDSDYYIKQGLLKDPYPIDIVDDIYFTTPDLTHRIELIKHLLEFSHQLLLATAPAGGGKTALFNNLDVDADSSWTFSKVIADKGMDPNILAMEMVRDAIPDEVDQSTQPISAIHKYLEHCHRKKRLPVLLIDDAHTLSIDTLEYITQLIETKHVETQLRIVLFGEASILKKLDDPRITASSSGILHTVNIPSLTEEQTAAYVEYRFKACDENATLPFTEKNYRQIYKVSGGIPGKINQLARQTMRNPTRPGKIFISFKSVSKSALSCGFRSSLWFRY